VRVRWLPVLLTISLLANIGLAAGWLTTVVDRGHAESDVRSTFRYLEAERAQVQAMRAEFCADNPRPERAALLAWEASTRGDRWGEPYDRDGLLWLRDVGVKLDAGGRLEGVCPSMTWQMLDHPNPRELDEPGACPLEPLC